MSVDGVPSIATFEHTASGEHFRSTDVRGAVEDIHVGGLYEQHIRGL